MLEQEMDVSFDINQILMYVWILVCLRTVSRQGLQVQMINRIRNAADLIRRRSRRGGRRRRGRWSSGRKTGR